MNSKSKYIITISLLLIIIITIGIIINYPLLLILYEAYTNPHSIKVFFFKGLTPIQNLSITLFTFYPTENGTIIKEIYHGDKLKYLSIPLSNLTNIAKHWIKHYNYKIEPSLIGFASYIINNTNGTITIITQPFTIRISPRNITKGIGKTEIKEFTSPIKKTIKIWENSTGGSGGNSNTVTTTTTVPSYTITPGFGYEIIYVLNNVWYYPSNTSLGPIPLSVAYITDPNTIDYAGGIGLSEQYTTSSGYKISFGITLFGRAAHIQIFGTSITTSSESMVVRANSYFGVNNGVNSQFAEIYTEGQIAVANYTEYLQVISCPPPPPTPIGNATMIFLTGLAINGSNNNYAPALYTTNIPNIPPTEYFSLTSNNKSEIFTVQGYHNNKYYWSYNYEISTSEGYLAYSVALGLILKIATAIGVSVAPWVAALAFFVSPGISITSFTSSTDIVVSVISFSDYSSNTYYAYTMYSNMSYNIGGHNYILPYYYYYVNYTS